ncbi:hypothetical protein GGI07_002084, partial [Coemansia sp. Benny D115]
MSGCSATSRAGDFILRLLASKKRLSVATPLVVGVSGAQGSGKTTLVRALVEFLQAHKITAVGFSLDDIYRTHADQQQVAETHRDNPLLRFRGQPGTHDLALGRQTLTSLLRNTAPTAIPQYDKSLNAGYGDRLPPSVWPVVVPPIDVVLFEGWCLGFRSLGHEEFSRFLHQVRGTSLAHYKYSRKYTDANLAEINENLRELETQLYSLVDAWVYMRVSDVDVVYRWRKEQEDAMAALGKPSLSDQQLEDFVSRFMPLYELAYEKLDHQGFVSSGILRDCVLRMHLDMDRKVVACDQQSVPLKKPSL